ncbi:MAG: hypothetical protein R3F46_12285 [bacterium]
MTTDEGDNTSRLNTERQFAWMGDWVLTGLPGKTADDFVNEHPLVKIATGRMWSGGSEPLSSIARGLLLKRFPSAGNMVNIASLSSGNQRKLLDWIERLRSSRVWQQLNESPNLLPEIHMKMHWLPGLFAMADRPRSREQMVAHLASYLDWYAVSQGGVPLLIQVRALATLGGSLLGLAMMYPLSMLRRMDDPGSNPEALYLGLGLCFGLLLAAALIKAPWWFWNEEALLRHLALYLYLRECEEAEELATQGDGDAGR